MDGARIFAESAIRDKNTSLNYLRLSSRIDAVAQRVNTAVKMQNLTKDMSGIVKSMSDPPPQPRHARALTLPAGDRFRPRWASVRQLP